MGGGGKHVLSVSKHLPHTHGIGSLHALLHGILGLHSKFKRFAGMQIFWLPTEVHDTGPEWTVTRTRETNRRFSVAATKGTPFRMVLGLSKLNIL